VYLQATANQSVLPKVKCRRLRPCSKQWSLHRCNSIKLFGLTHYSSQSSWDCEYRQEV